MPRAASGERVDVRRFECRLTKATEIVVTEVIREDVDDVGFPGCSGGEAKSDGEKEKGERSHGGASEAEKS